MQPNYTQDILNENRELDQVQHRNTEINDQTDQKEAVFEKEDEMIDRTQDEDEGDEFEEEQKPYQKIESFSKFYPFYLDQHSNKTNRRLHYMGTSLAILIFLLAMITSKFKHLFLILIFGYGFSWVGHFFFQRERATTFKQPLFSLMSDLKMWYEITVGKIKC